jgi:hypothetical protein
MSAKIAAKKLSKKGFICNVYKCRKCGYFHVGKPSYYDSPREFWHNINIRIEINDKLY